MEDGGFVPGSITTPGGSTVVTRMRLWNILRRGASDLPFMEKLSTMGICRVALAFTRLIACCESDLSYGELYGCAIYRKRGGSAQEETPIGVKYSPLAGGDWVIDPLGQGNFMAEG